MRTQLHLPPDPVIAEIPLRPSPPPEGSRLLTLVLIPVVYLWISPKEIKVKEERVAAALRAVDAGSEAQEGGAGTGTAR